MVYYTRRRINLSVAVEFTSNGTPDIRRSLYVRFALSARQTAAPQFESAL